MKPLVLFMPLLVLVESVSPDAHGRAAARIHLARGEIRYLVYGLEGQWYWHRLRVLAWQELRVEVEWVPGCGRTPEQAAWTVGYNQVMVAEIDRRFGHGALKKLEARAIEAMARGTD
ncbi:MAG: hypothetical protein AB7K24_26390 [Gemmataceae bacterium]